MSGRSPIVAVVEVCECHAAPIRFKTDRRRSHGGYEICSVTQREDVPRAVEFRGGGPGVTVKQ